MLAEYGYVLRPGGLVYTVTDVPELHQWMLQHFGEHPLFEPLPPAQLAADPLLPLLPAVTEEGQRARRAGPPPLHRRVPPPPRPPRGSVTPPVPPPRFPIKPPNVPTAARGGPGAGNGPGPEPGAGPASVSPSQKAPRWRCRPPPHRGLSGAAGREFPGIRYRGGWGGSRVCPPGPAGTGPSPAGSGTPKNTPGGCGRSGGHGGVTGNLGSRGVTGGVTGNLGKSHYANHPAGGRGLGQRGGVSAPVWHYGAGVRGVASAEGAGPARLHVGAINPRPGAPPQSRLGPEPRRVPPVSPRAPPCPPEPRRVPSVSPRAPPCPPGSPRAPPSPPRVPPGVTAAPPGAPRAPLPRHGPRPAPARPGRPPAPLPARAGAPPGSPVPPAASPPPRAPRPRGLAEMPGPSSAAFIFELLCRGGVRRLHEMQVHGRSRFGPVWRARFGPVLTVHVAEPALVAQVLRQEGPEPRRALSCPWKQHRELRGVPGGLLTLEGEAWRGVAAGAGPGAAAPGGRRGLRGAAGRGRGRAGGAAAAAAAAAPAGHRPRHRHRVQPLRPRGSPGHLLSPVPPCPQCPCISIVLMSPCPSVPMCPWAPCPHPPCLWVSSVPSVPCPPVPMSPSISWVLFSSRLGCLGDAGDTGDTEAVLRSVGAVLALTLVTMALPRPLLRLVPAPWDAFCHAWDQLFAFAKGHVDRRVAEVAARGPLAEGGHVVTDLLARERVPVASIYGNVTELLLAGVDTVASTLAWSLYELARNPGAQAALHRQLVAATGGVTGGDSATADGATAAATAAALGRLPLLRAVVKETLRLYPVIPANARVVPECDIRVGDYLVPRQTLITLCHYATSRDSRFFPAPDAFRPERWLRHRDTRHPFASLPFGLGPRSCVGRRLAELQLHMALAQILLRFEVRPEPGGGRVRPMTRTLLAPGAPISLRFLER
ncbi:LOW QUALITY PROTEIN: basic proline-rich protein-like [Passer domesticus]|uniref:LOW QUALITY PROTEIN: basic proline-rich protein-like n=1 Tax=Passer domesticus TaxID=48849 RepID=UPI0030FE4FA8